MYFPTSPVWYPADLSQVASVAPSCWRKRTKPFEGGSFPLTPWLCVYWPVRIDAREGAHSGCVA